MSNHTFKLISFSICPYVQRPRIVLLEKHIEHEIEYIDLQHPPAWFHEVSPLEKVPVLVVDGEALFESMPISEYLEEITPGALYPEDPFRKAQHRAWIEFGNDMLGQHFALASAKDEKEFKKARGTMAERLDTLEDVLSDGPYFAGEDFGMVDVVYAPLFRFTRELHRLIGLELVTDDTPKVTAWAQQLLDRPSVEAAVPASFTEDYVGFLRRLGGVASQRLTG